MASFEDIVKNGMYINVSRVKGIFCGISCDRCYRTDITVYCRFKGKDLCMLCCSQIIKLYKITKDEILDKMYDEKIKNDKIGKKDYTIDTNTDQMNAITLMATKRFNNSCTCMIS